MHSYKEAPQPPNGNMGPTKNLEWEPFKREWNPINLTKGGSLFWIYHQTVLSAKHTLRKVEDMFRGVIIWHIWCIRCGLVTRFEKHGGRIYRPQ